MAEEDDDAGAFRHGCVELHAVSVGVGERRGAEERGGSFTGG